MSTADVTASSSVEDRLKLITRDLQEFLGEDIIRNALIESEKSGKPPVLYWGTATTGRPHLGYFVPLAKIADFLKAGVHVKILLADVHAFLDNLKAPVELVSYRVTYYSRILLAVFKAIGVSTDRLEFVTGSSYQYDPKYNLDKYKLCAVTTEHDAKRAGAEVVKQTDNAPLSGLLYPLLQALDEEYLGCDMQFGGVDQRKIFIYAEAYLPKIGYKRRAHLMNRMVPGLAGGKMSSSDPNSKIDFLDPPNVVKKKIAAAYANPGEVEGNGLLAFLKSVLLPIATLRMATEAGSKSPFVTPDAPADSIFSINRPEKHGGQLHYPSYEQIETNYADQTLHPADLKLGVTEAINLLLAPIQKEYESDEAFKEIEKLAYPPPEAPAKKVKVKKVNPRFAKPEGEVADPPTDGIKNVNLEEGTKKMEENSGVA